MVIDVALEDIITLGEACREIPPKGISPATMARWVQRGVRGCRLETVVIGGRRLTSRQSLARFYAAQNASESPAPAITAKQRRTQAESANRVLQEAGL